jgi:uncharacterized membrane protein YkvA (DUF1232 family)
VPSDLGILLGQLRLLNLRIRSRQSVPEPNPAFSRLLVIPIGLKKVSMTHSQLLTVLDQTELSPEQLAPLMGVSNMTIRRWKTAPLTSQLPKTYESRIFDGIYQLIIDKHLQVDTPEVLEILKTAKPLSINAVAQSLGITDAEINGEGTQQDRMTAMLNRIGISESHRREVDESDEQLTGFKKLGVDWKRMISTLVGVVRSKELLATEKLVAYGALFYLICPFDLIPDHIPVFGLMDDFAVLSMAVSFYATRPSSSKQSSKIHDPR